MLAAASPESRAITRVERREGSLYLYSQAGTHRLSPVNDRTVRVTYTESGQFSQEEKPGVLQKAPYGEWDYTEAGGQIILQMRLLKVEICRETASCRYCDGEGRVLLREREKDSKVLEEFLVYRLSAQGSRIEKAATPDGVKDVVREAARIPEEKGGW